MYIKENKTTTVQPNSTQESEQPCTATAYRPSVKRKGITRGRQNTKMTEFKKWCVDNNITQQYIRDKTGLSLALISRSWTGGHTPVKDNNIYLMASVLKGKKESVKKVTERITTMINTIVKPSGMKTK